MKRYTVQSMFAAVLALIGLAAWSPAQAQSSACVYLEPGAGYAAWIRVVSGDFESKWSSSFPIGQHRCVDLKPIADGAKYTVQISAVLGSSKVHCKPDNQTRVAANTGSVTFLAWGTTFNVHCEMPSASTAAAVRSAQPTPEGQKAAALIAEQGDKLQPPAD
jgi:hypothetical protein